MNWFDATLSTVIVNRYSGLGINNIANQTPVIKLLTPQNEWLICWALLLLKLRPLLAHIIAWYGLYQKLTLLIPRKVAPSLHHHIPTRSTTLPDTKSKFRTAPCRIQDKYTPKFPPFDFSFKVTYVSAMYLYDV